VTVQLNGKPVGLPDGSSVADLLRKLEAATDSIAVERNRQIVRRRDFDTVFLVEGDQLELVTLVGGG